MGSNVYNKLVNSFSPSPHLPISLPVSEIIDLCKSRSLFYMTSSTALIEFFEGIPEELSNVSLRRHRRSGARTVLLTFKELKSLEKFNSFRKRFSNSIRLTDEEGEISVAPSSVKFIFGGAEGDDFERMECEFEIEREDHWERFMRFMSRYAEANGMVFGKSESPT